MGIDRRYSNLAMLPLLLMASAARRARGTA